MHSPQPSGQEVNMNCFLDTDIDLHIVFVTEQSNIVEVIIERLVCRNHEIKLSTPDTSEFFRQFLLMKI